MDPAATLEAPLVRELVEAVEVPVPLEMRVEEELPVGRTVPDEADPEAVVLPVEVPPLVGGGASPWVGSVSAPVPQRTTVPSVAFWVSVAGVLVPVESAMVKRVVKRGPVVDPGEVNL